MAHYVVYIPGVRGANPEHLSRIGCESLGRDRQPEWTDVTSGGPDGGHGMMAAWRTGDASQDATFGVQDKQWTACGTEDRRWYLGVETARPIEPHDLLRKNALPGVLVRLADDRQWGVPVADRLPHRYSFREGSLQRAVAPEHEAFCEAAARHAYTFFQFLGRADELRAARPDLCDDDLEVEVTLEDTWRYSVDALAINYRVNDDICGVLGLFDDASMVRLIAATIDLPDILDVRKKKEPKVRATIHAG